MVQAVGELAELSIEELRGAHAALVQRATELAGGTREGRLRGEAYYAVYEDSCGNFMFPLVATHGSLWGIQHTLRLESALRPLRRFARVRRWIDALDDVRDVNRRVFIEVWSTFYFTRDHGAHPRAAEIVKPELLALYNRVHDAVARGERLPLDERRSIYFDVFVHEQDDIVDPGVQAAAEACGTPAFVKLMQHVRPRFAYFPPGQRLRFSDFTDVDQRNREGLRAMDLAEEVGAERVREAMAEYPWLPSQGGVSAVSGSSVSPPR